MSLVGFGARNHPQQTAKRGAGKFVDDRETPWEVFQPLHDRFMFTVDVAASPQNTKLPKFYTVENDGLEKSWAGESVWCNPPYSDIRPWVEKAWRESGSRSIVMLLPANRTEQMWWQRSVEPKRDRLGSPLMVEFLPGRLRFIAPGEDTIKPNSRPPFGCCLLIWSYA